MYFKEEEEEGLVSKEESGGDEGGGESGGGGATAGRGPELWLPYAPVASKNASRSFGGRCPGVSARVGPAQLSYRCWGGRPQNPLDTPALDAKALLRASQGAR